MWRPRLPRYGNPDFWPVVLVFAGGPAGLAIGEGWPPVPVLLTAVGAVAILYVAGRYR